MCWLFQFFAISKRRLQRSLVTQIRVVEGSMTGAEGKLPLTPFELSRKRQGRA
jgi:hypothetical protein